MTPFSILEFESASTLIQREFHVNPKDFCISRILSDIDESPDVLKINLSPLASRKDIRILKIEVVESGTVGHDA